MFPTITHLFIEQFIISFYFLIKIPLTYITNNIFYVIWVPKVIVEYNLNDII